MVFLGGCAFEIGVLVVNSLVPVLVLIVLFLLVPHCGSGFVIAVFGFVAVDLQQSSEAFCSG